MQIKHVWSVHAKRLFCWLYVAKFEIQNTTYYSCSTQFSILKMEIDRLPLTRQDSWASDGLRGLLLLLNLCLPKRVHATVTCLWSFFLASAFGLSGHTLKNPKKCLRANSLHRVMSAVSICYGRVSLQRVMVWTGHKVTDQPQAHAILNTSICVTKCNSYEYSYVSQYKFSNARNIYEKLWAQDKIRCKPN